MTGWHVIKINHSNWIIEQVWSNTKWSEIGLEFDRNKTKLMFNGNITKMIIKIDEILERDCHWKTWERHLSRNGIKMATATAEDHNDATDNICVESKKFYIRVSRQNFEWEYTWVYCMDNYIYLHKCCNISILPLAKIMEFAHLEDVYLGVLLSSM